MYPTRRELLITSFLLPRCATAAARWLGRKPSEWWPDDIEAVLNHSAWVHEVPLGMDPGAEQPQKKNVGGSTRLTEFNIVVRWESGLPVRLARRTATLPDRGVDHYVIGVSRLPLSFLARMSGRNADDDLTRSEVAAELAKSTAIERAGKDPIRAEHAVWVTSGFSSWVSISFPRNTPIQLADWEVAVTGRIGVLRFRANFSLKPMVYRGRLEL